jgi:hypothetical protein
LKYFEAAIVGTVTVASNVFTFRNAIAHGENGFLVRSWDWLEQLELVIDALDTGRYEQVALQAAQDSDARYASRAYDQVVQSVLFGSEKRARASEGEILSQGDKLDRRMRAPSKGMEALERSLSAGVHKGTPA